MKDQIKCNIITKHLAGLSTKEEAKFLTKWLKENPRNHQFFSAIQFQLQVSSQNLVLEHKHA